MDEIASDSDLAGALVVVDVDLTDTDVIEAVRVHLGAVSATRKRRVFVLADDRRSLSVQARVLGADIIAHRPLTIANFVDPIAQVFERAQAYAAFPELARGLAAGEGALDAVFASARFGAALSRQDVEDSSSEVVAALADGKIDDWIAAVRRHHSQTYQHCLLVTGVAVAFGRHLGFAERDLRRLATAGLLHDIGKAKIPLAVLEKPGPLDESERKVMMRHPRFGYEVLARSGAFPKEMLSLVLHHHEYLDGSGYPDGLTSASIGDLVRLMTIADIFAAMIEARSYKPSKSAAEAFAVLTSMRGKLDMPIVRALEPVALQFGSAA